MLEFGSFRLDPDRRELLRDGRPLAIQAKLFDTLVLLAENRDRVVDKQELLDSVWPHTHVEESTLFQTVSALRKVLSNGKADGDRHIATVPGRGYRFVAATKPARPLELPQSTREQHSVAGYRAEVVSIAPSEVPRVAVLPLKTSGGDAEIKSLAAGLTEEITAGLSRFRHLSVVTASADARYDQESADVLEVGKELGARFVLEGRVRKATEGIRVNARLLDAKTGTHLWAERFDRDLVANDIFEAQDELTDRIVATVADPFGVLTRSLGALAKAKPVDTLTADECVLRWFSYWETVHEEEHAELRTAFERVLEREPNHADARACLCLLYIDELRHDYSTLPDTPNRALRAAQRAVEIDPTSPLAYRALAEAHFFRGEIGPFRQAADRVLALNPRDTSNVGFMGTLIAYSGDWDTGCPLVRKATQLNPHHGGWMHIVLALDHCRKREHEQALAEAEQINMPGYPWASGIQAIIHSHLGNPEKARAHLKTFLELAPDMARNVRAEASAWLPADPELAEHCVDGLRKAGLEPK